MSSALIPHGLPVQRLGIIAGGLILLATYLYVGKALVGPDDNFWGPLRRTVLPLLDRELDQVGGYATNRSTKTEYAGVVDAPPERVERYI